MFNTAKIILMFLLLFCSSILAAKIKEPLPAVHSIAPIIKSIIPSIVNLTVHGEAPTTMNPNELKVMQSPNTVPQKFIGSGSGVIIDKDQGYILTNAHVIKNAVKIMVSLQDGRIVKAKIIGSDPATDVAVIQIKEKMLAQIKLGNSNNIEVGDFVAAIGNPFSLDKMIGSNQTVTFGIISALKRSEFVPGAFYNFIQTDAATNMGSSGGALINMKGELIGITTSFLTPTTAPLSNVGINFAIPINMAQNIMDQLIEHGSIKRGFLGVIVQAMSHDLAKAFKLPNNNGVIVTQVNKNTPAEQAGFKSGDILLSINGQNITDANHFKTLTSGENPVGTTLKFAVLRDGKQIFLHAKTTDISNYEQSEKEKNPFMFKVALQNYSEKSPTHGLITGIQIQKLLENTPAFNAGLIPGDIIVEIDKRTVKTIQNLTAILQGYKENSLLLKVIRGEQSLYAVIKKE